MAVPFKPPLLRFFSLPIPTTSFIPFATTSSSPPSESETSSPSPSPPPSLSRGNTQLDRWSRSRALRSGRSLGRRNRPRKDNDGPVAVVPSPVRINDEIDGGDGQVLDDLEGKAIYLVSDGTGWTAEQAVSAALGQWEHCLVDRACAVNTHLFSGIDDVSRLMEIIQQAGKERALLLYTLADPTLAEATKKACELWAVPFADILGPTTDAIAAHLGVAPLGIPRGAPGRQASLSEDYFKRIEAIDFTIKQDDGALPQNLSRADIVLLGVSRTGKTPLSIYLAQKGYKVANVPIVIGLDLPKTVFQIDQSKIFALTINPLVLQTIRQSRANSLGFNVSMTVNYSEMDHVKRELDFAGKIFAKNPVWPVIEVTGKAIEETAAVIVRIQNDRLRRYTMPRISRRY